VGEKDDIHAGNGSYRIARRGVHRIYENLCALRRGNGESTLAEPLQLDRGGGSKSGSSSGGSSSESGTPWSLLIIHQTWQHCEKSAFGEMGQVSARLSVYLISAVISSRRFN
jgi:hypothetical protein